MNIEIVYASEKYLKSFYEALKQVAAERVYLEMFELPSYDKVVGFQRGLIARKGPIYYAVEGEPGVISLYRKMGFQDVGFIQDYRRVDSQKFDALMMAKFL